MTKTLCYIFPSHSSFCDTKIRFLFFACLAEMVHTIILAEKKYIFTQSSKKTT